MNVEIQQLTITLHDAPIGLGDAVAGQIDRVVAQVLSQLRLSTVGTGATDIDLGVIKAPAHADAHTITELIASSLVDWLSGEHDDAPEQARRGEGTAATGATGAGR